jgi:MFS family permease
MSDKASGKWYTLSKSRNTLTWIALIVVYLVAAMGSGIENSWFNTFVYQEVTPNPNAVSAMVSVSAITAALSAIIGGAASDRHRGKWGRRRPFLAIGFFICGLFTILFPFSSLITNSGLAVAAVVIADGLMMVGFGIAYDGVLNGYVTDTTNVGNRGRVQSVLQMVGSVGGLLTSVVGGILIDTVGYTVFFLLIGGALVLNGVFSLFLLQEQPVPEEETQRERAPIFKEIFDNFKWENIVANKNLFLLLLTVTVWGCGMYCAQPYILTFALEYLQFSATQIGIVQLIASIIGMIIGILFGILSDKWGRKKTTILLIFLLAGGSYLFSTLEPGVNMVKLAIITTIYIAPLGGWYISYKSWSRDLFPKDKRAQFSGITLFFVVTLPMVIGSQIGAFVVTKFGIPVVIDGEAGFTPTPIIFIVAAAISLLAIIPMMFIKQKKNDKIAEGSEA